MPFPATRQPIGAPLSIRSISSALRTSAPARNMQKQPSRPAVQFMRHSSSPTEGCSVPARFSEVSCVILKRLGASAAAPSPPTPIRLSARTAAPRGRAPLSTLPAASSKACSVLARLSEASCGICRRLGASFVAPNADMSLSAFANARIGALTNANGSTRCSKTAAARASSACLTSAPREASAQAGT